MVDIGNRYWALIVEDEPEQVMLIKAVFAHFDANAHINVAKSAEEAIIYIKGPWQDTDLDNSELPAVIVPDIKMEGMGGLGFLEWYASEPKIAHVPIVVFTSSEDVDLERQCLALGAREFKVKPADYSELVTIVQHVLKRWQSGERQSAVANASTHQVAVSASRAAYSSRGLSA